MGTKKSASGEEEPLDLTQISADVAGATVGGILGYLINDPMAPIYGTAAGVLLSHTIKRGLSEMRQRLLGRREVVRIDATFEFAAQKIKENIEQGKQLRQDDFFQEQPGERAAADEILEGILLAAQREHQEKKLRFYGNLVANIAFSPSISREHANLLIRVGESLSYRQLCLLRLFAVKGQFGLRQKDYTSFGEVGEGRAALLQEIYDLYSHGMVHRGGAAMLGLLDVTPGSTDIQGTGAVLHNLMELWLIDPQDLEQVASLLR